MTVLGIDPGATGGLAVLDDEARPLLVRTTPSTEGDVARLFERELLPLSVRHCWIEKVHAFPDRKGKDGELVLRGQGVVSAFTFGRGAGVLIGCLYMAHIPFEEVEPRMWQKCLGIPPRAKLPKNPRPLLTYPPEESHGDFKRRLREKAQQLFPEAEMTLRVADALLIAYACLRVERQGLAIRPNHYSPELDDNKDLDGEIDWVNRKER